MAEIYTQLSYIVDEVYIPKNLDPRITEDDLTFAVASFLDSGIPIPTTICNPETTIDDPNAYSPIPPPKFLNTPLNKSDNRGIFQRIKNVISNAPSTQNDEAISEIHPSLGRNGIIYFPPM